MCRLSVAVIVNIRKAVQLIKTREEANSWRKHLNKIILLVQRRIRQQHQTAILEENKFKLESNLTLLKFYREKVKTIGVKTGAGVRTSKTFLWQDVTSVFRGRIKTGVILNSWTFKERILFLQKAK